MKHYSPGEIMMGRRLHANDLHLKFGTYCQVAENVELRNSLAPRTRAAIALGSSGNLSGGQVFLALDTGHTITRHQWVVLPMPPAIIARVNILERAEPSILTFTDRQGRDIGDYPRELDSPKDEESSIEEYVVDVLPATDAQDNPEIPGVPTDHTSNEPATKSTGVEVDHEDVSQVTFEDELGDQADPIPVPREHAEPTPVKRGKAHTAKLPTQATVHEDSAPRVRRPPERYIPSMKGKKYL